MKHPIQLSIHTKEADVYLVFGSALLSLFSSRIHCRSPTSLKKVVTGSLLRIILTCSHCSRRRTWENQPYIGKIPAGNILTSAAILYSGALPSKALWMFQILNLARISRKNVLSSSGPVSTTSNQFCLET